MRAPWRPARAPAVSVAPWWGRKKHGRWVESFADGGVQEGPYVDGKKHGQWVSRRANGDVFETEWRNGEIVD